MSQPILLDPIAVAANRRSELTPEQRSALINQAGGGLTGWLGCGFAAVIIVPIVLVAGNWLSTQPVLGAAILIVVLIGSMLFAGRITSVPMRRRLIQPEIEQVRGQIVWEKGNYGAQAGNRPLVPIYGALNLPPGVYDFCCLQHSRWLLSAEPVSGAVVETPTSPGLMPSASTSTNFTASELAHALLQANGFRASDLERNREGHLTGHQISDLLGWTLGIFVAAVLLLGLGAIVISRMNSGEEGTSAVLGLGLFALVGGLFLYNSFEKLMDALGGEVLVVEGIGAKFTRSTQ